MGAQGSAEQGAGPLIFVPSSSTLPWNTVPERHKVQGFLLGILLGDGMIHTLTLNSPNSSLGIKLIQDQSSCDGLWKYQRLLSWVSPTEFPPSPRERSLSSWLGWWKGPPHHPESLCLASEPHLLGCQWKSWGCHWESHWNCTGRL